MHTNAREVVAASEKRKKSTQARGDALKKGGKKQHSFARGNAKVFKGVEKAAQHEGSSVPKKGRSNSSRR